MSLAELVLPRRSLFSALVELGGLAIAATGLMWIGSMRERVALIETRLERIEIRQVANSHERRHE